MRLIFLYLKCIFFFLEKSEKKLKPLFPFVNAHSNAVDSPSRKQKQQWASGDTKKSKKSLRSGSVKERSDNFPRTDRIITKHGLAMGSAHPVARHR